MVLGKAHIDVDRPWWSAFAYTEAKARDISSNIMARISNVPSASLKAEWNAALKARVINEVHAGAQAAYMDKSSE